MGILYLTEEGTVARKQAGRIVVYAADEELLSVPIEQVTGMVVFSGVQISSHLTTTLLEHGIPVTYLSSHGRYFGRLEPVQSVNVERQLKQVECMNDPHFVLTLAAEFLSAKVHNALVILREFVRHSEMDYDVFMRTEQQLQQIYPKFRQALSVEEMLGYEGEAARLHFACLSHLTRSEYKFKGRTRNPPKDPFNSMLSYGYTLLLYDFYTILQAHGLYPYFGFMHKPHRGHPALASDLMEEWRPVLVDAFVLHLANRGTFHVADFTTDASGGVYLGPEQSKLFVQRYEERVKKPHKNEQGLVEFNYRIQLEEQVIQLAKAVDNKNPLFYKSYRIH